MKCDFLKLFAEYFAEHIKIKILGKSDIWRHKKGFFSRKFSGASQYFVEGFRANIFLKILYDTSSEKSLKIDGFE